mmetsp:Transcript_93547/g.273951  ORF Transcript_93547/g.273951 Transcript_93547/m.273951 type:complete len:253 (+) Transcript_93547:58-816(+)
MAVREAAGWAARPRRPARGEAPAGPQRGEEPSGGQQESAGEPGAARRRWGSGRQADVAVELLRGPGVVVDLVHHGAQGPAGRLAEHVLGEDDLRHVEGEVQSLVQDRPEPHSLPAPGDWMRHWVWGVGQTQPVRIIEVLIEGRRLQILRAELGHPLHPLRQGHERVQGQAELPRELRVLTDRNEPPPLDDRLVDAADPARPLPGVHRELPRPRGHVAAGVRVEQLQHQFSALQEVACPVDPRRPSLQRESLR